MIILRFQKMKKIFLLLLYFSGITIGYSQKADSSKTSKIKLAGIYISAGINVTQYNSRAFFDSLSKATGAEKSNQNPYVRNLLITNGSLIPRQITYSKLLTGPTLNAGLILNTGSYKNIYFNHLFEVSCNTGISGTFSYSNEYQMEGGLSNSNFADITDTFQFNYSQNRISIGYKFQPTYKFMFLSIGLHCSYNSVKVTEYKKEQIYSVSSNPDIPSLSTYSTTNSESNNSVNKYFINVPVELGIGGIIHIKRISLEPTFYFTPSFNYGYNFYNFSLKILFVPKKTNEEI